MRGHPVEEELVLYRSPVKPALPVWKRTDKWKPDLSVDDVDSHVMVRPNVREVIGRDRHSNDAARGVSRRIAKRALGFLREAGSTVLACAARAIREQPVRLPVHGHESGRAAEGEEIRIAAGVGAEVQLLAGQTLPGKIRVGDRPEAPKEVAVEKRVALLNRIGTSGDCWSCRHGRRSESRR